MPETPRTKHRDLGGIAAGFSRSPTSVRYL
jgi:hypothetical protein